MIELHLRGTDVETAYVCEIIFSHWQQWKLSIHTTDQNHLSIGIVGKPAEKLVFGSVSALETSEIVALITKIFTPNAVSRLRADCQERIIDVHGVTNWLDKGALAVIFWLLSGQSESTCSVRDNHGRVSAAHMLLVEHKVLDLPIVDLLAEYLIDRIRSLQPDLPIPSNNYQIIPTHDVDAPFKYAFCKPFNFLRSVVTDAISGVSLRELAQAPTKWLKVRSGNIDLDPFNCFSEILDINESYGLQSEFYFIAGHSGGRIDGDYDIENPIMFSLLKEVVDRGHLIGLHSSYNAPFDATILNSERERLQKLAIEAKYFTPIDIVRNHYLRFDPRITPNVLSTCGFRQDSTLAFAEMVGFRRGTCRSFPLWDLENKQPLSIIERPLIAMECSLVSRRYENLSYVDAANRLDKLKAECRRFGGKMVVLWHNNYLRSAKDFELYEHAIR